MERVEAPLPEPLVRELGELWETIPELPTSEAWRRELLGLDQSPNDTRVYIVRRENQIVAMCQFYVSHRLPIISEFTYPGTHPSFRGEGIATELWTAAIKDIEALGIEAIFLGTNDRVAFRLYRRLGFSKLPGALTFLRVLDGRSPEEFLVDWFRDVGPATVSPGDLDDKLPSYPLVVSPHEWQVLDANAGLMSSRYSLHHTFAGLYIKCADVGNAQDGTRFSARTEDGRVVGMSTGRLDRDGSFAVDGFVHYRYRDLWNVLIEQAAAFGKERGAGIVHANVSREDGEKRTLFEALGFREVRPGPNFVLDGLQLNKERQIEPVSVPGVRMERNT